MKAVVLGNKDLAVNCLEVILQHDISVVGVVPNSNDDGGEHETWYRSLRRAANRLALPVWEVKNISSPLGLRHLRAARPDLLFSFSYNRIVRKPALELVSFCNLNVHFSRLPHFRGCLSLVHALAQGDDSIGVTLHVMDEGIDTGGILAQTMTEVTCSDTAFSMYFKCVDAGTRLVQDNIDKVMRGDLRPRRQQLEDGSYHSMVYPNDRWLSPHMTSKAMACFVRAHTFAGYPTARACLAGQEVSVTFDEGGYGVPALKKCSMSAVDLREFLLHRKMGSPPKGAAS